MGWSTQARARALRATFLGGGVTVGLLKDDGKEESAGRRQLIHFADPKTRADGAVIISNKENIAFPPYENAPRYTLAQWVVFDKEGVELVRGDLISKFEPPAGLQIVFVTGDIEIGIAGAIVARAMARAKK